MRGECAAKLCHNTLQVKPADTHTTPQLDRSSHRRLKGHLMSYTSNNTITIYYLPPPVTPLPFTYTHHQLHTYIITIYFLPPPVTPLPFTYTHHQLHTYIITIYFLPPPVTPLPFTYTHHQLHTYIITIYFLPPPVTPLPFTIHQL